MGQDFLSAATLPRLPARVAKPAYDRAAVRPGVVHLGPGAFHRAHQAAAFDAILARDPRWGITGVSLHSPDVADALNPQDGLYTLALLDEQVSFRVIGAIQKVLVAPRDPEAVLRRLAAAETEIVTLTITEKGYCLGADGQLDFGHADIRADLANRAAPKSAIGFLAEALRRRREANGRPFVVISCDNLVDNGGKLGRAVITFAAEHDPDLSVWIAENVEFPCTMVDSITPATTDALRERVAAALGVTDRWPIQREAFTQWVIQRHEHQGGPDWQAAGVTLTDDVSGFERAKLRVLNASHSALAYLGLARGHETVRDAIADPELAAFVRDLMTKDVAPSLKAPEGLDLAAYIEAVLKRFHNPEIRHLLSQIAWDGSQKLPNRLFGLIEEALAAGRPIERPARIVAAWLLFLRRKAQSGDKLTDPLAPLLLETAARARDEAGFDVPLFLGLGAVFPARLAGEPKFKEALVKAYGGLLTGA
ncbi:MAG TPA: mannitol dehydrogenase family protein [Caulobacterales bacterium]|nr:mannitol dehydrogenase family protein [Caulobacterales bacterium]